MHSVSLILLNISNSLSINIKIKSHKKEIKIIKIKTIINTKKVKITKIKIMIVKYPKTQTSKK